jgi:hypothetical protein
MLPFQRCGLVPFMRKLAVLLYIDIKRFCHLAVFRRQLNYTNEVSWLNPLGAEAVGSAGDASQVRSMSEDTMVIKFKLICHLFSIP